MSTLPRQWGRLVKTVGLIVSVAAVGVWSISNPVVAVLLFASGVVLMAVPQDSMPAHPRMWRRLLVFVGALACVSAVSLLTELHPLEVKKGNTF